MIAINKLKNVLLVGLLITVSATNMTCAQEVEPGEIIEKKDGKMWRLGKEARRTGNGYLALKYFEEIYQRDSANVTLINEMATLYRATHNYPKTELFYSKIVQSKKADKYPEAYFYLAQAQKNNLKYAEAKENFMLFKKKLKLVEDETLKKLYKTELEGCEMGLLAKKDSNSVVVRHLGKGVNHPHIDFSPIALGDDEMIYGTYPDNQERVYKVDEAGEMQLEKRRFYTAKKVAGEWKTTGELPGPFNDTLQDVANACYSLDSTRFYITKCTTNWQYKVVCAIYESIKENGEWSEPVKLGEAVNMPDFTSTHPTFGRESRKNREVMYFVSDREKGRGGLDIWFSEYDPKKKEFKKARNAGSKVNSAGNDVTPFYDLPTKTLYFSTDGWPNLGGLDVYTAIGESRKWEPAKFLATGVNTAVDELDYSILASNRGGYFVSNRKGGLSLYHPTCCDDIYEFEFSKYIDIMALVDVVGEDSVSLLERATVNLYLVDENSKLLLKAIKNENDLKEMNLRPNQKYVIEATKEGYYPTKIELSTEGIVENTNLKRRIRLERHALEPIVIPNINFEFDSPKLTPASKITVDTTLLRLFERQPNIKIEISAHTDSKGSDDYNMKLSQRRAESIVKYLNSKGVPMNQMIPKGYGETKPIAPNANADGSDNPEGRQKNRRVDFSIIGEIELEMIEYEEYEEEIDPEGKGKF